MKTTLGKFDTGKDFTVDMVRFMETRTLVMASSGGGKSWVLRKIIEELVGKCQVLVIDVEGEFLTLREKFDFVVAGKGGDVSADPRYADALCRRLLELNTDTICDLQELKQHERVRFVRVFLESLMNVPKDLWKPVAVVLDEAHLFAPEKGNAESANAVIDVGSRGRKRGFFLIPATQRLSKLHKDVAAECQNKLIGLANLDIDRKRAAEELGFTDKTAVMTLWDMNPGEFYAVGPAFGRGVQRVKIGAVKTRHPQPGSGRMKMHAPVPTAKVKAVLSKLADLPKEAEQEAKTLATLRIELSQALMQIRHLQSRKPETMKVIDTKEVEAAFKKGHNAGAMGQMKEVGKALAAFQKAMNLALRDLSKHSTVVPVAQAQVIARVQTQELRLQKRPGLIYAPPIKPFQTEKEKESFGRCERAIISVLAQGPEEVFNKAKVAARSGYSKTSGGFNNALAKLNANGLIERHGDGVRLKSGIDVSHLATEMPQTLQDWISKLSKCEGSILKRLLDSPGETVSKEILAEATGYSATSGGFNNAIAHLNTLALIKRGSGGIEINPELEN